MTTKLDNLPSCPDCGARIPASADHCWLCNRPLDGAAQVDSVSTDKDNRHASGVPSEGGGTFLLSSLMLTIALISVLLGVARLAPGLGIVLFVLVVPAYVRTVSIAGRRRGKARALSVEEKSGAFIESIAVAIVSLVAGGAAFFATCFVPTAIGAQAGNIEGVLGGAMIGALLGLGVGLWVAIWVGSKLWPRRD